MGEFPPIGEASRQDIVMPQCERSKSAIGGHPSLGHECLDLSVTDPSQPHFQCLLLKESMRWAKAQFGWCSMWLSFQPIVSAILLIVAVDFTAPNLQASPSARDDARDALSAWLNGDYEIAIEKAYPLAEQGDPLACGIIGQSYSGLGDHVRAYAWYGLGGEQYLAAHQLEGLRLSPEELEAADELMYELGRQYCRD